MAKPDFKAAYERRNARAKAEGYKSYNDKRVKEGQARGLTKSQAAGKPKKGEKSATEIKKEQKRHGGGTAKPTREKWFGYRSIETPYTRKADKTHKAGTPIIIPMLSDEYNKWQDLLKAGKPKAAKVYALDAIWGVPELAGLSWDDDFPYDEYEDWYDIPEYDDKYAASDAA